MDGNRKTQTIPRQEAPVGPEGWLTGYQRIVDGSVTTLFSHFAACLWEEAERRGIGFELSDRQLQELCYIFSKEPDAPECLKGIRFDWDASYPKNSDLRAAWDGVTWRLFSNGDGPMSQAHETRMLVSRELAKLRGLPKERQDYVAKMVRAVLDGESRVLAGSLRH